MLLKGEAGKYSLHIVNILHNILHDFMDIWEYMVLTKLLLKTHLIVIIINFLEQLIITICESFATVGEIRVYWRADFQSGSRVLKKVF